MRSPSPKYIFFVFLLAWCSYAITIPLTPEIYIKICKGNISQASIYTGIHTGINSLASFLASPTIGALSDKYGRKPLLITSLISFGILIIGLLTAEQLFSSAYLLFFFSFCAGLLNGIFPVSFAYVVDVSTTEKRSANFGLIGAAVGVAFVLGPALGSIIAANWDISGALLIALFINISGLIFVVAIVPESKKIREYEPISVTKLNPFRSFAMLRKRPLAMFYAVVLTLIFTAQFGVIDVYVLYFKYRFAWKVQDAGIALSFAGLIIALSQGLGIRWAVPKLGERRASIITVVILTLFTFPMGLVTEGWMVYIVWLFLLPGYSATPLLQSLTTHEFDGKSQGELLGVLGGLKTLDGVLGPLISNNLFAYFISEKAPVVIPGISFFSSTVLYAIALVVLAAAYRKYPEIMKEPDNMEAEMLVQSEESINV